MRIMLTISLLAAILVIPATASANSNPYRTETQATNYLLKRVYSGTSDCVGRKTGRPHSDLYQSFVCILSDYDTDTGTAYRLDTRPRGRWFIIRQR